MEGNKMKKAYINPAMEIIKIQTQQLIAASVGLNSTPVDASAAEGREFDDDSFFDE